MKPHAVSVVLGPILELFGGIWKGSRLRLSCKMVYTWRNPKRSDPDGRQFLTGLVAHDPAYIVWLEMFAWQTPTCARLSDHAEFAARQRLAANQACTMAFWRLGLALGLWMGNGWRRADAGDLSAGLRRCRRTLRRGNGQPENPFRAGLAGALALAAVLGGV